MDDCNNLHPMGISNGHDTNNSVATYSRGAGACSILSRISICVVGVGLGFLTFMPNIMMSDSGSTKAIRAANIGMAASVMFVVGGVLGCIYNSWWSLLPGFATQVAALIYFG